MKKKIYHRFICIAGCTVVMMLVIMAAISYQMLRKQIFTDMKAMAAMMARQKKEFISDEKSTNQMEQELRITVISQNGVVLSDSEADSAKMDNHLQRTEVQAALKTGEGTAVRNSGTLSVNTFYYALRLSDGTVLRLAQNAGSALTVLKQAMPATILLSFFMLLLAVVLSHMLTNDIVVPIEKMGRNMEQNENEAAYEELRPFVKLIREQHAEIMKGARMRQEFTANVSHELKTPLTSISGYSELIENGMAGEEDTVRFAGEIHKNADRLLSLINDIIKLSQMDVAKDTVSFQQLDLNEMASNSIEMLQMNAENHKVHLSYTGELALINGNREMIEEVIYNLTDNAIRYNRPGGSVSVTVKKLPYNVVLTVADTGIGIPKEHQERIFERFYRVDKSRSKQLGGTGLGLAIVKHIILLHGASLELQSRENLGTIMKVIF